MLSRSAAFAAVLALGTGAAQAATCGTTGGGFEAFKAAFASEARAAGVGQRGLQALAASQYATKTIAADRNQKSFKYTLEKFMEVRGANTIIAQGRKHKARNANLFGALERQYGVPAGVLLAIHGMETGFGNFMGDSNVVSAITTLAYECRRSEWFKPHAIAALKLVDNGTLSPNAVGARHGEWGHTQFLPGNIITYGIDGDGNGRVDLTNYVDAMASTSNFLRQKGWQPGAPYQEGQTNFNAIKAWNAAGVYQKAIAIMAARIDG